MATRKGKTKSDSNGEGNGEGNGAADETPGRAVEFDAFVDELKGKIGELHAQAWIAASDPEGRTIGSRLGKLPLEPLDTLDERIEEQWRGPRRICIRAKIAATGHWWPMVGYFDIPPPRATPPAPPASDPAMSAVLKIVEEQKAELKEMRTMLMQSQRPPAADVNQEVGALERLSSVFRGMMPPPAPPAPAPPPPKTLKEQLDELGAAKTIAKELFGNTSSELASSAHMAIKEFAPGINKVIEATAALVAFKVTDGSDEREKALEAKRKARADAAKEVKEVKEVKVHG